MIKSAHHAISNIILLGAPGSGKGTQSEKIVAEFEFVHVSTGDIIRSNIKNATDLGKRCQEYLTTGALVPDELVLLMVEQHLPTLNGNVVWDGFPRTVNQAEKFDQFLAKLNRQVDHVLYLEIDEAKLLERIAGRLTCPTCGRTYHEINMPTIELQICDVDQTQLVKRKDDRIDVVQTRLEVYKKDTEPLIQYYLHQQRLTVIDADMDSTAVWDQTAAILR